MEQSQEEKIKELEKIHLVNDLKPIFSEKWVEKTWKWVLIFIAVGLAGKLLTTYIIDYILK